MLITRNRKVRYIYRIMYFLWVGTKRIVKKTDGFFYAIKKRRIIMKKYYVSNFRVTQNMLLEKVFI